MQRLLVADDSTTIRRVVQHAFAGSEIEVTTVENGRLALEQIRRERPDLLLCDVLMPELSGYDVLERLQSDPETKSLPVLLLTGAFEPFDEERALRSGAVGFLSKPFESRILLKRVEEVLKQQQAATAAPLPAASSAVDFSDLNDLAQPAAEIPASESPAPAIAEAISIDEPLGPLEPQFTELEPAGAWPAGAVPLPGDEQFRLEPAPRPPAEAETVPSGAEFNAAVRDEVQRQLQQIAPEIIREVAWEVVPDLLERLLRESAPAASGRPDDQGGR